MGLRIAPTIGVAAGLLMACAGVPGSSPNYAVDSVTPRGPLVEASIEWQSSVASVSSLRRITLLFVASDEVCRRLLVVGTQIEYLPRGQTGTLRKGDDRCEAVGIAELREWRDRRPRPQRAEAIPRAQANFRMLVSGDTYAIVRGRFPLANLVGWSGGEDTLALFEPSEVCDPILAGGVATVEFRAGGRRALTLIGSDGHCPIHGLARSATPIESR